MTTLTQHERADLTDPGLYINRELSWIEFNSRVLALAARQDLPLLERCRFLGIFYSNLDEFFMVRVAGVQDAIKGDRASSSRDRLPREVVLEALQHRTRELLTRLHLLWQGELLPSLAAAGLPIVAHADLPAHAQRELRERFEREIEPVLTPLAVGPGLPFPFISPLSLNLGVIVRDPSNDETRFARVKVPPGERLIEVDGQRVFLEDLIDAHLERVFPGMVIDARTRFRVTRNADFSISDEADDLLGAVEAQIRRRRFGDVIRLEVEAGAPPAIVSALTGALTVSPGDVFEMPAPLDFSFIFQLTRLDRPELRFETWEPRTPAVLQGRAGRSIFDVIRSGDVLVHHPYEDFTTSVEELIEQAVEDPDVLAIKQTLYRTSGDSPLIPALAAAAESGKQVVCMLELQARFDEARNIRWARHLEQAGVHVVYGLLGLKTHAKLILIVRREGGRLRRYVHIGTGNYNPSTARAYTDFGLFTCHDEITEDVADLFNFLTGFAQPPRYRQVLVAPDHVRSGIVREIRSVVAAHAAGTPGRIVMKMNSLTDGVVIEELYRASRAGVPIDLIIRGICSLRPGVLGVSETIRVVSVVGRFLEHTRAFMFCSGPERRYFLGSADMMERNLDHRVELIVPVLDPAAREDLRRALDLILSDTSLAWQLDSRGTWTRVEADGEPLDSQEAFMQIARERADRRVAGVEPG